MIKKIIKNKFIFISFVVILSSCILFFKNIFIGDDLNFHLSRILFIRNNIVSKNMFSGLYYIMGYGYGEAFFYPDFFLYIPALFYFFNDNIVISYKIFLILINLCTALSVYYSVYKMNGSKINACIITLVYLFLPYRLCTMYYRSSLGESIAFIFFPIVLSGFFQMINGDADKWYILTIGMSCLIISHLLSAIFTIILLIILTLVNIKKINKNILIGFLKSILVTILITGFFIFPFLEQLWFSKFKFFDAGSDMPLNKKALKIPYIFTEFNQLFANNGLWIPPGIGIILTLSIVIFVFNYKKVSARTRQLYIIGMLILISTTNIFPWKIFTKYIKFIQFPWRFLPMASIVILTAFLNLLSDLKISKFKNNILIGFIMLVSIINVFLCYISLNRGRINYVTPYIAWGEYLPVEFNEFKMLTKQKISSYTIYNLKANDLTVKSKKPFDYEIILKDNQYIINFKNNSKNNIINTPIIYYRGYVCYINGKKYIPFKSNDGLVGINLSDKNGTIIIKYEKTFIQVLSRFISLFSFIILILYILKKRNMSYNKNIWRLL